MICVLYFVHLVYFVYFVNEFLTNKSLSEPGESCLEFMF